jgi:cell division protein FtsZ
MKAMYEFDVNNTKPTSIIKIIGVGGGGGNAVNYMYAQGIKGVDFIICNTDFQALKSSPVPFKIQLGSHLTEGLGAGANPEVGKNAALESKEEIRQLLSNNTKMAFITAGMGGGTGTGAAPVVAEICKSLGILTVGIVTMPFAFEGKPKEARANSGVEELKKHCDTVLVILNNRIKEFYGGKTSVKDAFNQADSVLSKAAKAIAEIITVEGMINVDFEDVKTVMKDSGAAVMGSHTCDGENRAIRAAEGAINSPLLNNTNINGAKRILLSIVAGNENDFQMSELEDITNFIQEKAGSEAEVIYGQAFDSTLGNAINVTVIATGFDLPENQKTTPKPSVAVQPPVIDLNSNKTVNTTPKYNPTLKPDKPFFKDDEDQDDDVLPEFISKKHPEETPQIKVPEIVYNGDYEIVKTVNPEYAREEIKKKFDKAFSNQSYKTVGEYTSEEIRNLQEVPAYKRIGSSPLESDTKGFKMSKVTLNIDSEMLDNNRFLHNNVD